MKYDIKQIVEGLKAIALGTVNSIDYINIQNNEEILKAANDLSCLSDDDLSLIDAYLNKRGWNHRNSLTPRSGVDLYNLACRIEKINEREPKKKYDIKQIAKEIKETGMGLAYHGNSLLVAKDLSFLANKDRALLDSCMSIFREIRHNKYLTMTLHDLYELGCRIEKVSMKNELKARTPTTPCLITCEKCGGTDISRHYRKQGEQWDKLLGQSKQWETEHAFSGLVYNEAKKECITHHCRTCSYGWTTDVLNVNERKI